MAQEQCRARVYDTGQSWDSHQCRNKAVTVRTVSVNLTTGPKRIPVCRIHQKQQRREFAEYRGRDQ